MGDVIATDEAIWECVEIDGEYLWVGIPVGKDKEEDDKSVVDQFLPPTLPLETVLPPTPYEWPPWYPGVEFGVFQVQ